MKHLIQKAFFVACLAVLFPPSALAETTIAIVDVQRMLSESKAAVSIQEQIKKHRDTFMEEITRKEDSLRAKEKELMEARSSLSQEELSEKRDAFEEELLEARKMTQNHKRALEKAAADAMNTLRTTLFDIVQGIADERNISLVITRQQVVVGEKSLDISDEVLEALDQELDSVDIALEGI